MYMESATEPIDYQKCLDEEVEALIAAGADVKLNVDEVPKEVQWCCGKVFQECRCSSTSSKEDENSFSGSTYSLEEFTVAKHVMQLVSNRNVLSMLFTEITYENVAMEYTRFITFIWKHPEPGKSQLATLIYPLTIHLYLILMQDENNGVDGARLFLHIHSNVLRHKEGYKEVFDALMKYTNIEEIKQDSRFQLFIDRKFIIKLSRDVFRSLEDFLINIKEELGQSVLLLVFWYNIDFLDCDLCDCPYECKENKDQKMDENKDRNKDKKNDKSKGNPPIPVSEKAMKENATKEKAMKEKTTKEQATKEQTMKGRKLSSKYSSDAPRSIKEKFDGVFKIPEVPPIRKSKKATKGKKHSCIPSIPVLEKAVKGKKPSCKYLSYSSRSKKREFKGKGKKNETDVNPKKELEHEDSEEEPEYMDPDLDKIEISRVVIYSKKAEHSITTYDFGTEEVMTVDMNDVTDYTEPPKEPESIPKSILEPIPQIVRNVRGNLTRDVQLMDSITQKLKQMEMESNPKKQKPKPGPKLKPKKEKPKPEPKSKPKKEKPKPEPNSSCRRNPRRNLTRNVQLMDSVKQTLEQMELESKPKPEPKSKPRKEKPKPEPKEMPKPEPESKPKKEKPKPEPNSSSRSLYSVDFNCAFNEVACAIGDAFIYTLTIAAPKKEEKKTIKLSNNRRVVMRTAEHNESDVKSTRDPENGNVYVVKYLPGEPFKLLAVCALKVKLFNTKTCSFLAEYVTDNSFIYSIDVDSTCQWFATANHYLAAYTYTFCQSHRVCMLTGHERAVTAVKFHPNGIYVATGSEDCTVRLFEVESGRCVRLFVGHLFGVCVMDFSYDGSLIASADSSGYVKVWGIKDCIVISKKAMRSREEVFSVINSLCFHEKRFILAASNEKGEVQFWDVKNPENKNIVRCMQKPLIIRRQKGNCWYIAYLSNYQRESVNPKE